MKEKQKKIAAGVGVGIALAAAAAAIYLFTGEEGKKRRKKVSTWATNMKQEAVDALKEAKHTSKKAYHQLIDELAEKYVMAKNVNKKEALLLATQLKTHWDRMQAAMKEAQKSVKKKTKKTSKK
ncbi:MAG: hypothetical protein COU09_01315 [Candidatus Harrisonbacteria bacterium CG10_big_fil_rev_8_21_14_0_10_44_23]|uniref:Uncharacterized protein n=1 Tax=Candidatus Harrisonbacteria bacterium CG10_big_fil_rev_8_21_14_0_10_44_23 TaxID=1974585 RepID=A0A2H0US39_9BACT|nr:MAG: hypothetical protein COU09_01315 [Candidatus Harrisonbacteria bacterium CG10_big_fil_rev_8_21_14_0_10_44_23]